MNGRERHHIYCALLARAANDVTRQDGLRKARAIVVARLSTGRPVYARLLSGSEDYTSEADSSGPFSFERLRL